MRELRHLFVTWLAVYLLVTSLMFVAGPLLAGLPLMLRTLVLTLILVPMMRYGLPWFAVRARWVKTHLTVWGRSA